MLMMITITFAKIGLSVALCPKKPIGSFTQLRLTSKEFTGPKGASKFLIVNNEINCGIAIVKIKIVRNTFLPFNPFLLIKTASKIPPK